MLAGDFSATQLNEKWLADITAIPTHEGWLYLAGIQDAFSRQIVGWYNRQRQHSAISALPNSSSFTAPDIFTVC